MDEQQTPDDAYKQWNKVVIQSNDTSGTLRLNKEIYDILPNQLYRIRISATNDLSEGSASESVTVKTESGGQFATSCFDIFFELQYFYGINILFKFRYISSNYVV